MIFTNLGKNENRAILHARSLNEPFPILFYHSSIQYICLYTRVCVEYSPFYPPPSLINSFSLPLSFPSFSFFFPPMVSKSLLYYLSIFPLLHPTSIISFLSAFICLPYFPSPFSLPLFHYFFQIPFHLPLFFRLPMTDMTLNVLIKVKL